MELQRKALCGKAQARMDDRNNQFEAALQNCNLNFNNHYYLIISNSKTIYSCSIKYKQSPESSMQSPVYIFGRVPATCGPSRRYAIAESGDVPRELTNHHPLVFRVRMISVIVLILKYAHE